MSMENYDEKARRITQRPDPGIYRRAAELMENDEHIYSCFAIMDAVRESLESTIGYSSGLSWRASRMYMAQYEALFSNRSKVKYVSIKLYDDAHVLSAKDHSIQPAPDHPWWSKDKTPERKEQRILALLLMADIVESGG